jgi:acetyl-CoA carboxylase biotin carboxyl carrier protein
MKRSELTEFAVEEEGFKLKIRRGMNGLPVVSASRSSSHPFMSADTTTPMPVSNGSVPPMAVPQPVTSPPRDEVGITYIKSPMVGTFYRSSSPGSKAFVDVGSAVKEGDAVCIIEAMKIMNEIEADTAGTITRILCDNGQAVEFGQPLFVVE